MLDNSKLILILHRKNYYLRFIILFYIFDILGKDALKIHLTYSSVITIVHIIMRIEEISGNINS